MCASNSVMGAVLEALHGRPFLDVEPAPSSPVLSKPRKTLLEQAQSCQHCNALRPSMHVVCMNGHSTCATCAELLTSSRSPCPNPSCDCTCLHFYLPNKSLDELIMQLTPPARHAPPAPRSRYSPSRDRQLKSLLASRDRLTS